MRTLGLAVAAVLLLAGCAPQAAPSSSPTTPATTPSPSSAPELACADLIPQPDLQAQLVTPIGAKIDESSAPRGALDAIFLQAGGVHCVWGGQSRTDASWDEGLDVRVLSAELGDVDTILAATTFPEGAVFDTLGERSGLGCQLYPDSSRWICNAILFVGDRVVSARVSRTRAAPRIRSPPRNRVLDEVSVAIEATSPSSTIVPEPGSFDGGAVCTDPSITAGAYGIGAEALTLLPVDPGIGIQAIAAGKIELVQCMWQTGPGGPGYGESFSITVIPGAGWQFERMQSQPEEGGWGAPGRRFADPDRGCRRRAALLRRRLLVGSAVPGQPDRALRGRHLRRHRDGGRSLCLLRGAELTLHDQHHDEHGTRDEQGDQRRHDGQDGCCCDQHRCTGKSHDPPLADDPAGEEAGARQVARGTPAERTGAEESERFHRLGVRERLLESERDEHDAGHENEVQVGVSVASRLCTAGAPCPERVPPPPARPAG